MKLSQNNSTSGRPICADDIMSIFDGQFLVSENTKLIKGDDEPIYTPASQSVIFHQIVFAHGYVASALHEVAHWCVAGKARRQLEDYGYWYCPDGRNQSEQLAFEQVEVKPQAIEWAFSAACGKPFRLSIDNLNGEEGDTTQFAKNVYSQILSYLEHGFPMRAQQFINALRAHYGISPLEQHIFTLEQLR